MLYKDEVHKIVTQSMKSKDPFDYALFYLAHKTGRRIGEYYDIRVYDINESNMMISARLLKKRKPFGQDIVMDDQILWILRIHIEANKLKDKDYLFRVKSYRTIQRRPDFFAKKAGILKPVVFHNFRHYVVTEMRRQGYDDATIGLVTGHKVQGSIRGYDHTTPYLNGRPDTERNLSKTLKASNNHRQHIEMMFS